MIPITVITGFLGAGKTTLVNRWLAELPRGSVAVIVNEVGKIGIDGELLAGRVEQLVEIAGGCVCCATQEELVAALASLETAPNPPARILIETSGAASPAGVIRAIGADLDGIVTVVDASRVETLLEQDLAIEQVGYADVVMLSRADEVETDHAQAVVSAYNGAATILSGGSLHDALALRSRDFERPAPTTRPHDVYESISLQLEGEVDEERFADFMETVVARFATRIFRTKGVLAIAGEEARVIVQGVADKVEVTFGAPWSSTPETPKRTRLVVVGYGLEREELERAFAATRR